MFRFTIVSWSSLLILAAIFLAYALAYVDDEDRKSLLEVGQRMPLPKHSHHAFRIYSQQREGLRRDLWVPGEDGRLQTIHYADRAELTAQPTDRSVVEILTGVRCLVQESIDGKMGQQGVCSLEADSAVYDYHTGNLQAQPVRMARFRLPGRYLPDTVEGMVPLMQGEAQSAQIVMDKELTVHAQGFKGRAAARR